MTAGLPLAIELAASWLKGLRAAQIAQEMQRNLDFLSTTMRNVEERHRSMRAVFDQSWKMLSENERLIFARLSVFAGGFDGDAAGQVAGASFINLAALVEKSLVQMESSDRFGIHELLRQYGMERLEAYLETEETYARHSQYFAQLMLRHETALRQPPAAGNNPGDRARLREYPPGLGWSAKHRQATKLHIMLNGLYLFGFLRSRYRETITIFQYALEQPVADAPLLGRLLARRWGYLHWLYQADYGEALASIEQALTIAVAGDNRFEIAFCHLMAAYAMISTQRYVEALPHLETSRALFEAVNEPYYVCWVLHRIGYVYYNLKDSTGANDYTEQSLTLARATHNRVAHVICLYNLGSDYILSSDYIKGKQYCTEALQVATDSGHRDQIAHALSLLALCAFCQGEYKTCRDYAERSWKIIEDINSLVFEPYNRALRILLACLREEYAEGVQLSELGDHNSTNKMGLQLHYWAMAALYCGVGSATEVRVSIQKVFQLSEPSIDSATTIWIVPSAAYALVETDPAKAVELISWARSYPDTALNWARQWPLFERLQAQLQAAMDRDSYQMHWEKGKALSFDAIDAYLQHEFRASAEVEAERRTTGFYRPRSDILRLMAVGNDQPADRCATGDRRGHCENPHPQHLPQAGSRQPHTGDYARQELGLLHA